MNIQRFIEWLQDELDSRDLRPADFARKSGISTAQVSRVLSREQNPGIEFYEGTARAFNLPVWRVIAVAAGEEQQEDLSFTELVERLRNVDPATREIIYDIVVTHEKRQAKSKPLTTQETHEANSGDGPRLSQQSKRGKGTQKRGASSA